MKKKTTNVTRFLDELHGFIVAHPQFRQETSHKTEAAIHAELRPVIIEYLEKHFDRAGYKDSTGKANKSFYWEGQEGRFGKARETNFGTRNYPDFIITAPYLVAIEYKQSASGSVVKHGIGQSIMHTLCGDFDYVYFLFHDENRDKKIEKSPANELEAGIIRRMWNEFNVLIRFV